MAEFNKREHTTKWIALRELSVLWNDAQRHLKPARVDQIVAEFDPDYFGVIFVTAKTETGIYHVIDGQHRIAAMLKMWGDPSQQVPCFVIDTTDPKRAADIFNQINSKRSGLTPVDLFTSGVAAGYETEVAINKLLRGLGYRVANYTEDGTLRAISTVTTIYKRDGEAGLRDVLLVVQAIWGRSADSVEGTILAAFAKVLREQGKAVDRERLVARMSKAFTPGRLIGQGKAFRDMFRGSLADNICRVIIRVYNDGLRKGQLAEVAPKSTPKLNGTKKPGQAAYDAHSGIGVH